MSQKLIRCLAIALVTTACITEDSVVERSTDALAADLTAALDRIDALEDELAALRDQVGETEETATLEERVRGLTQEGFAGRVGSLEVWRDDAVDPNLAALDARATTSEAALTEHGGRLGTLETWRVAVDGSLSDHETRIGALEDDLIDVVGTTTALTGRVTTLEGWRTGTADPTLTTHADRLNVLEIWRVDLDDSTTGVTARLDTLESWRDTGPDLNELDERAAWLEAALEYSVLAYNVGSCPEGWVAYEPASGRFLRGVDFEALDDPDSRAVGSLQDDALQGHRHYVEKGGIPEMHDGVPNSGPWGPAFRNMYTNQAMRIVLGVGTDPTYGTARVADETRPTNVAVLYCTPSEA